MLYTYLIPLQGRRSLGRVFKNTFPAPEKCLYTLFRRRRSAYIHLSGAGEAGEAGEIFIYTPLKGLNNASLLLTCASIKLNSGNKLTDLQLCSVLNAQMLRTFQVRGFYVSKYV